MRRLVHTRYTHVLPVAYLVYLVSLSLTQISTSAFAIPVLMDVSTSRGRITAPAPMVTNWRMGPAWTRTNAVIPDTGVPIGALI